MCGKCEHWVTGVLGLFVLVMPFLTLDAGLQKNLMIASGLVIAVMSFLPELKKRKMASKPAV